MGQDRREVHVTGGKMKGRRKVKVDVSKGNSITGIVTGRKEAGKKGTRWKAAGGKVNNQVDSSRRSYSEAVIENRKGVTGDSILRNTDKTV